MQQLFDELGPEQRQLEARAETALRDHNLEQFLAFGDGDEAAALEDKPPPAADECHLNTVLLVKDVFHPRQCASIIRMADQAASRRGGWNRSRHGRHPTTDLEIKDLPEVEPLIRETVFRKILRPLAPLYFGEAFLPENLELRDFFIVRYSASENEQRALETHADGSVFSFNILLSEADEFVGGGTAFEATNCVVKPARGAAVVHSGDIRHGGREITRGERYILVGFVNLDREVVRIPYCVAHSTCAAKDAFLKFGRAAFERSPLLSSVVLVDNQSPTPGPSSGDESSARPPVSRRTPQGLVCDAGRQACSGDDGLFSWARTRLEPFGERTAVVWVECVRDAEPRARSISYGALTAMASGVSAVISRSMEGASQGAGVGLCLDNSLCMAVCQLACLWAGRHFVPLPLPAGEGAFEPKVTSQLVGMLAGVELIGCLPAMASAVEALAALCDHRPTVIPITDAQLTASQAPPPPLGKLSSPTVRRDGCQRFCTFHTSGTTGTPKPVHSSYAEFEAFATAAARPYRLHPGSRVFAATSHVFDPSAGLTFAAWAVGAAVCLCPFQHALQDLRGTIELTRATHVCSTPTVWALYHAADHAADHRAAKHTDHEGDAEAPAGATRHIPAVVMLGGEPMPAGLIRQSTSQGIALINTYGTTEATVYQFAYALPAEAATLTDDELHQHALCLGEPFEGISYSVTTPLPRDEGSSPSEDGSSAHGRLAAHDGVQPALEVADAASTCGELVLIGLQVGIHVLICMHVLIYTHALMYVHVLMCSLVYRSAVPSDGKAAPPHSTRAISSGGHPTATSRSRAAPTSRSSSTADEWSSGRSSRQSVV